MLGLADQRPQGEDYSSAAFSFSRPLRQAHPGNLSVHRFSAVRRRYALASKFKSSCVPRVGRMEGTTCIG
jgi:hypothetical protein